MAAADHDIRDGTFLDEAQLKHISRDAKNIVPDTVDREDVIKEIRSTFDDVFATSAAPNLGTIHRVTAWNTLCALLDRCTKHRDDRAHDLLWSGNWWSRAFDLYLTQAHLARPKSGKQLLSSLTAALRDTRPETQAQLAILKRDACQSVVQPLANDSDPGHAKTCASALGHFLEKDVLLLDAVLNQCSPQATLAASSGLLDRRREVESLLRTLFEWLAKGDFSSTIGQLVTVILSKAKVSESLFQAVGHELPVWASPLIQTMRNNTLNPAALRVHLLPTLFRRNTADAIQFLDTLGWRDMLHAKRTSSDQTGPECAADLELLCASLQALSALGFLHLTDKHTEIPVENPLLWIPYCSIARLLKQQPRIVRLTGLALLLPSVGLHLPASLITIRRNLGHFYADTDANFRGEVLGKVQQLVDLLRNQTFWSSRSTTEVYGRSPAEAVQCYRDYLESLIQFLQWELRPTASYQRHVCALRCLAIFARSGLDPSVDPLQLSKSALGEIRWPIKMAILTADMRRLLLDLVINPYDDIRQAATSILSLYPSGDGVGLTLVKQALGRAEATMLATGRADQADGVAHLYELLSQREVGSSMLFQQLLDRLEQMMGSAKADLSQAVERYPAHGLLTSLRYLLVRHGPSLVGHPEYVLRLAACLCDVWDVVKPVLCNDAPEGYLPEDMDETQEVSTKDTLSYCWRALKEASLLLGAVLQHLPQTESDQALQLSDLCFTQLAELRHRGAFSTVAQTWVACCIRCQTLESANAQPILQVWYKRTMLILRNKTTINTRRSAGLPSLLCGILIASQDTQLFQQAFNDLDTIAREAVDPALAHEGSLPQVHAMNCMKDILKNSRLGEVSDRHVPTALKLAADALRSQAWAVRNCGLMLFRAVIDRLLGTSDAHLEDDSQVRKLLSTEQHPELLEIVLGLLRPTKSAADSTTEVASNNEGVFPALQLLQRLVVPDSEHHTVRASIRRLMASPVWHVRDKAARTYAALAQPDTASSDLETILQTESDSQNALHGALLCAKHIVRRRYLHRRPRVEHTMTDIRQSSSSIADAMESLYVRNTGPVTRAAYLDVYLEHLATLTRFNSRSNPSLNPAGAVEKLNLPWVLTELQSHLSARGVHAALRLSLARVLGWLLAVDADTSSEVQNNLRLCLSELATQDADACCAVFEKVSDVLSLSEKVHAGASSTLAPLAAEIIGNGTIKIIVKCAAVELLLQVWHKSSSDPALHELVSELPPCLRGNVEGANQRYADLLLQLEAICLEASVRSQRSGQEPLRPRLHIFVNSCKPAVSEDGAFAREAAAAAIGELDTFRAVLGASAEWQQYLLTLCLAVYDLLNDDDEDIRVSASVSACKIIRLSGATGVGPDVVPPIAAQRLMKFMLQKWSGDGCFIQKVLKRAFGIGDEGEQSVADQLHVAMQIDTALFVEEKQNLYIDEAQEVRIWSQAAMVLPTTVIPKGTIKALCRWVAGGLDALLATPLEHPDGSLGWTSKPELFTLCLRVIYAAQLLLRMVSSGGRLSVRPSAIRRRLAELASGDGMHPLLRESTEKVLAESVARKLELVHALAAAVSGQARSSS